MIKPLAFDLFCKAGGAGEGLRRAGFEVIGVDIEHQPNYRAGRFVQGDALYVLDALTGKSSPEFARIRYGDALDRRPDFIWASPPCQGRTAYKRRPNHVRPIDTDGMIAKTRDALAKLGVPYIIENVPGAPLFAPVTLCGSMFDETIGVRRHRIFETSFAVIQPPCRHERQQGSYPPATNRANRRKTAEIGVWRIPLEVQREAMGIAWMTREELSEAIPPAYAEWLGNAALAHIARRDAIARGHFADAEIADP